MKKKILYLFIVILIISLISITFLKKESFTYTPTTGMHEQYNKKIAKLEKKQKSKLVSDLLIFAKVDLFTKRNVKVTQPQVNALIDVLYDRSRDTMEYYLKNNNEMTDKQKEQYIFLLLKMRTIETRLIDLNIKNPEKEMLIMLHYDMRDLLDVLESL
ncbi:MAG: hypothetical protein K0S51_2204 [Bacillales bacterium]|jgi:hypothetical protein|nr:hypothetical protein [Bacillales bacterium]